MSNKKLDTNWRVRFQKHLRPLAEKVPDEERSRFIACIDEAADSYATIDGGVKGFIRKCYELKITSDNIELAELCSLLEVATDTKISASWMSRNISSLSLREECPEDSFPAMATFKDVEKDAMLFRLPEEVRKDFIKENLVSVDGEEKGIGECSRKELNGAIKKFLDDGLGGGGSDDPIMTASTYLERSLEALANKVSEYMKMEQLDDESKGFFYRILTKLNRSSKECRYLKSCRESNALKDELGLDAI